MAEAAPSAPQSLGDFFAKKGKKKIKGNNLNFVSDKKPESAKKPKSKDAEEEGWQEEQVVAATMKVEVAGKLTREEEKKEEEEAAGHAWGSVKAKADSQTTLSDRKFPTLAKSVRTSTNINIDDGSEPKVNISTSKNVFAALDNEEDDDDQEAKRPKEIKPAMVQKRKGERERLAIQREVDKYSKDATTRDSKDGKDDEEDDDEAEEDALPEQQDPPPEEVKKKRAEKRVEPSNKARKPESQQETDSADYEDLKIPADLEAAKAKYKGRRKPFPPKPLPREELEEEKENKPAVGGKKKKVFVEEDDKPKLQYMDD